MPDKPTTLAPQPGPEARPSATPPKYAVGEKVETRKAYGDALVALGARDDRIAALAKDLASPQGYLQREPFVGIPQVVGE